MYEERGSKVVPHRVSLVIARMDYWAKALKAAVQEILQKKKRNGQRVRSQGTAFSFKAGDQSQSATIIGRYAKH